MANVFDEIDALIAEKKKSPRIGGAAGMNTAGPQAPTISQTPEPAQPVAAPQGDVFSEIDQMIEERRLNEGGRAPIQPKQDNAIERGIHKATSSADFSAEMGAGDYRGAAENIAGVIDYQRKNPGSKAGNEISEAWESGDGIWGGIKNVAGEFVDDFKEAPTVREKLATTGENLSVLGGGVVEQMPNMVLPMGGMLAGGLAGGATAGPVGAVIGGFAGASAGNTAVEGQGIALQEIQKAGIDPNNVDAVTKFLSDNAGSLFGKSVTKGAIIGAIDTATAGLGGKILTAPAKAAAARTLADMGVDVGNKAAVEVAMQSKDFATRIATDTAYQASKVGAGNIARNVGAAALEPAGEFAGEYLGSGVAMDDWDTKNAALEAMSSMGQSAATYAGQKVYQGAVKPGSMEPHDKAYADMLEAKTPEHRQRNMNSLDVRMRNLTTDALHEMQKRPEKQKEFGIEQADIDWIVEERAIDEQILRDFAGASNTIVAGAKAAQLATMKQRFQDRLDKEYNQYNPEVPDGENLPSAVAAEAWQQRRNVDELMDDFSWDAVSNQQNEDIKRSGKTKLLPAGQGFELVSDEQRAEQVGKKKVSQFWNNTMSEMDTSVRRNPDDPLQLPMGERNFEMLTPVESQDRLETASGDDLMNSWTGDAVTLQQTEDSKKGRRRYLLPAGQGFELLSDKESAERLGKTYGLPVSNIKLLPAGQGFELITREQVGQKAVDKFFIDLMGHVDQHSRDMAESTNKGEVKLLTTRPEVLQGFEIVDSKESADRIAKQKQQAISDAKEAGYISDKDAKTFEAQVIADRQEWQKNNIKAREDNVQSEESVTGESGRGTTPNTEDVVPVLPERDDSRDIPTTSSENDKEQIAANKRQEISKTRSR